MASLRSSSSGSPPLTLMQQRVGRWIDDQIAKGKLPRGEILVKHRGRLVCAYNNEGVSPSSGSAASSDPTIYRLYSMTKPIVSLAVLLLFEEGRFQLNEPVWKFLGEKWKKQNMTVMDLKQQQQQPPATTPCKRSITIHHLLTHTSGLSHGLSIPGIHDPLDAYYKKVGLAGVLLRRKPETEFKSLQHFCDRLAECPLLFQPGEHWHYSYSVDLLGRIVEVVSGQTLEDFLQERILRPLGMRDTSFSVPATKAHRLSGLWLPRPHGPARNIGDSAFLPEFQSGSGGLYGTCGDYLMFAEMLLRGGLTRDGKRICSKKTIEWMSSNHLRSPKDNSLQTVRSMGCGNLTIDMPHGVGFGLGFAVAVDVPVDSMIISKGTFYWSGAASTFFWVDPQEDLVLVFCTQLLMPDPLENPIHPSLHAVVYGSMEHDDPTGGPLPSSRL